MAEPSGKRLCTRRSMKPATLHNFSQAVVQQTMRKQTEFMLQEIVQHLKENPEKV